MAPGFKNKKIMTIKFIKGTAGIGLGYSIGDTASHFTDAEAQELIDSGFAEELTEKQSIVNPETADKEIDAEISEVKEEVETADEKSSGEIEIL